MSNRHSWLILAALAVGAWSAGSSAQGTFHLYVLDTKTGVVTQATQPMDYDLYNASFSNDGKKLVHDLVLPGAPTQWLGITDIRTRTTTPLYLGGVQLEGDNAVWSPNGQYIAYSNWMDWSRDPSGATPIRVVVMSAPASPPVLVRNWGLEPSWSNNSRRLAFDDWLDGHIGTVGLDGSETNLGVLGAYGCNPSYSPDGKLIVFQRYECFWGAAGPLMAIPVNERGEALGAPYPITSGAYYADKASFSKDGKTIVFSGNVSDPNEWGLYTVSVYGGNPVKLHDVVGSPEYNAAYSKDGRYVVFSSSGQ